MHQGSARPLTSTHLFIPITVIVATDTNTLSVTSGVSSRPESSIGVLVATLDRSRRRSREVTIGVVACRWWLWVLFRVLQIKPVN